MKTVLIAALAATAAAYGANSYSCDWSCAGKVAVCAMECTNPITIRNCETCFGDMWSTCCSCVNMCGLGGSVRGAEAASLPVAGAVENFGDFLRATLALQAKELKKAEASQ